MIHMKPENRDFPDLDTPAVPLPTVACKHPECTQPGVNLVLVQVAYELRCPEHTPAAPVLTPPEEQ